MREPTGNTHKTFEAACLAQSLAATLAALPEVYRKTTCEDGSEVSTIYMQDKGMWETVVFYEDGGSGETLYGSTRDRADLNHETLTYQHGGRKGPAAA